MFTPACRLSTCTSFVKDLKCLIQPLSTCKCFVTTNSALLKTRVCFVSHVEKMLASSKATADDLATIFDTSLSQPSTSSTESYQASPSLLLLLTATFSFLSPPYILIGLCFIGDEATHVSLFAATTISCAFVGIMLLFPIAPSANAKIAVALEIAGFLVFQLQSQQHTSPLSTVSLTALHGGSRLAVASLTMGYDSDATVKYMWAASQLLGLIPALWFASASLSQAERLVIGCLVMGAKMCLLGAMRLPCSTGTTNRWHRSSWKTLLSQPEFGVIPSIALCFGTVTSVVVWQETPLAPWPEWILGAAVCIWAGITSDYLTRHLFALVCGVSAVVLSIVPEYGLTAAIAFAICIPGIFTAGPCVGIRTACRCDTFCCQTLGLCYIFAALIGLLFTLMGHLEVQTDSSSRVFSKHCLILLSLWSLMLNFCSLLTLRSKTPTQFMN